DDALVVPRARALLVLIGRDAEEQDAGEAERRGLARLRHGLGDREAVDAGHRRDRRAPLEAGLDEHRKDEVPCIQARLAHDVPQDRGATQPSEAGLRKGHAGMVRRLFPLLDAFRRSSRPRVDCCEVPHRRRQALRCENCLRANRMSRTRCSKLLGREFPLSSTRSLRGSTAPPLRPRTARAVLCAIVAALAAAVLANPARADLAAVGPIDPATQLPAWFQDANGLKLGLCLDGPPFCLTTADEFNAPDGEAFWWNAGADLASGGTKAKLILAQEAVNPAGGRGAFMRVRVRITGARPSTTYTARHPFGTVSVTTNASGTGTE